jgi:addiction module RelE/StbE family toxin
MYKIDFKSSCKKDFKKINKGDLQFIYDSLLEFTKNFSSEYEIALMNSGKIKKLQGQKEVFYRFKLRSYRVIYKKYEDKLIILVVHVTTREGAYK